MSCCGFWEQSRDLRFDFSSFLFFGFLPKIIIIIIIIIIYHAFPVSTNKTFPQQQQVTRRAAMGYCLLCSLI
jgi:hypothetical protein